MVQDIRAKPIFIKPSLVEFQKLIGKKVRSRDAVVECARPLTKLVPLICISSVDGGALLLTPSLAWFGILPKVKVKTTVGAGDSMVGAISSELWKRQILTRDAVESLDSNTGASLLRHGLAAACATLTTHGTGLGTVLRLAEAVSVKYNPQVLRRTCQHPVNEEAIETARLAVQEVQS